MKNKIFALIVVGVMVVMNQVSHASCGSACGPCGPVCGPNPCCPCNNWYVAGSGSVAWHNALKFQENAASLSVNYKTGWGAAASVGYLFDMCNGWDLRLEGEFVYRRNNLKNVTFTVPGIFSGTGSIHGHNQDAAIMANLIADMGLFCDWSFYLGGGIGASFNKLSATVFGVNGSRSQTLFAWQFLTGLSYCICQDVSLTVGYRLFGTTKSDLAIAGIRAHHSPLTQSVDIGLRFGF